MGFASYDRMERAFAQRREQIIGDCAQLRTDVDAYNDMSEESPIQLVLEVRTAPDAILKKVRYSA